MTLPAARAARVEGRREQDRQVQCDGRSSSPTWCSRYVATTLVLLRVPAVVARVAEVVDAYIAVSASTQRPPRGARA